MLSRLNRGFCLRTIETHNRWQQEQQQQQRQRQRKRLPIGKFPFRIFFKYFGALVLCAIISIMWIPKSANVHCFRPFALLKINEHDWNAVHLKWFQDYKIFLVNFLPIEWGRRSTSKASKIRSFSLFLFVCRRLGCFQNLMPSNKPKKIEKPKAIYVLMLFTHKQIFVL